MVPPHIVDCVCNSIWVLFISEMLYAVASLNVAAANEALIKCAHYIWEMFQNCDFNRRGGGGVRASQTEFGIFLEYLR